MRLLQTLLVEPHSCFVLLVTLQEASRVKNVSECACISSFLDFIDFELTRRISTQCVSWRIQSRNRRICAFMFLKDPAA